MKIPENWELLQQVSHQDIKPFIKECLTVKGVYRKLYTVISMVSLIFLIAFATYSFTKWLIDDNINLLIQFLCGTLFSLSILIIIHELIHALAYRLMGAKHIYFGANIKKFVFYAASDGDIINGKAFGLIALAPFAVISLSGLSLCLLFPYYTPLFVTILALHNLFCGGDFAMLNFINQYPVKKIFTVDLRAVKESYFYLSS